MTKMGPSRCFREPGGFQANSRGLSDSDTPGMMSVVFTPAGWQRLRNQGTPVFCDPYGVNPLICDTGGVAKLTPPAIRSKPSGLFSEEELVV